MPRRDPHTGKFVSGNKPADYDRREVFAGGLFVGIPAADNSGGQTTESWDGEAGLLFDFDDELHSDELFHLTHLEWAASLALPTTATAESSAMVGYILGSDSVDPAPLITESTSLIPHPRIDNEVGVIDTAQTQSSDDSIFMTGVLQGEASFLDTVNALGGGGDYANENRSFRPAQDLDWTPTFDAEDELFVTGEMETHGVSDHQVVFSAEAVMHGWVEDFD